MLTCIHTTEGLCESCQEDYDEDPLAYWEFGQHPEGIARWEAFQAELAAEAAASPEPLSDSPHPSGF